MTQVPEQSAGPADTRHRLTEPAARVCDAAVDPAARTPEAWLKRLHAVGGVAAYLIDVHTDPKRRRGSRADAARITPDRLAAVAAGLADQNGQRGVGTDHLLAALVQLAGAALPLDLDAITSELQARCQTGVGHDLCLEDLMSIQ